MLGGNNVPAGCSVDPVNYFGSEHMAQMVQSNKRGMETEEFSRKEKLQISLNSNVCQDEADRATSIPKPNLISTGLRLSYDDDAFVIVVVYAISQWRLECGGRGR